MSSVRNYIAGFLTFGPSIILGLSDIRTIFFGFGLRTCSKNYEIATPDLKQVKRYFHFLKFLRTTTLSIVNKAIDKKKKKFSRWQ